jgi:hypothetical protein
MAQVNWRLNKLMAGAVMATSLVVGVTPAGALGDAPPAVAAVEREYCSGLDSFSVHRLYRAYFLREPDAGGLAYWQDVLATGRASLHGISQLFATSPEFTNRYGSLSNRAFVRLVYRNVMDREGEQAGVDYWTGLLDAGHPRGTVMLGFSDSAEFKARTGLVPPLPAATDPQVLPEIDPFTVLPGGEVTSDHETATQRVTAHRYPPGVSLGEILAYTGDQLLCLGWTVVADGSDGQSVGVVSANGIRIRAIAVRDGDTGLLLMVTDLV